MNTTATKHSRYYISLLYLVLLALLLYIVVPQLSTFKQSLPLLHHTQTHWLALAVAASIAAHIAAGFKYSALALKPIRIFPTVLVQLASLVVNRILPVGIGGMGINYLYLHKSKHTKLEAGVVVSMNNIVGFVGHMLLVALVLTFAPHAGQLHLGHVLVPVAVTIAVMAAAFVVLRAKFQKIYRTFLASLRVYAKHPLKLLLAIAWSMAIAALYATCLWYSALALNVDISFLQALIVLTLGVTASTVSPTPGGLVGVEAALVAGLILYNVHSAEALAVALLYRLITYWFALLLGILAFIVAKKQKYI